MNNYEKEFWNSDWGKDYKRAMRGEGFLMLYKIWYGVRAWIGIILFIGSAFFGFSFVQSLLLLVAYIVVMWLLGKLACKIGLDPNRIYTHRDRCREWDEEYVEPEPIVNTSSAKEAEDPSMFDLACDAVTNTDTWRRPADMDDFYYWLSSKRNIDKFDFKCMPYSDQKDYYADYNSHR